MKKLMVAGLLVVVCGVQTQPALALATDPVKCLENYGKAEQLLEQRMAELGPQKLPGKIVMGVSGGGWMYCLYRSRSVGAVVACSGLFGVLAYSGSSWIDLVSEQMKKAQDAATIMRVYSAIKLDAYASSDEVIGLMRDMRVDVRHEEFARGNIVREMEKGSLCDPSNTPNMSYEEFQSFVKPGDL